jgi:hypothetical protein
LTTNSSEFQLSLQTSLTLNNLILQGSAISTSPGSSSASTLTLVNPTFVYASSSPYFYSNTNGGFGYTTVLLNPRFPLGAWNGQARAGTTGSTKLRVVFTQDIKYLQGITPQQNIKTAFISSDTTNAPSIYNLSSGAGATGSINLLRGLAQPNGSTPVTLPVITWSAYVKKPGKEISTPLYTAKQFTAPDDSTYQTSTDPESVLTDAQIIAATPPYAGIAINKGTKTITLTATNSAKNIYNGVLWFLYQDANMDLAQFASFVSSVGDFSDWNIVGAEFATGLIKTTGAVTATAAFVASVTGNVTQATPTDLTGVTITGNLTFNTNTPITITLTNTTISGTVSNTGTGLVTITLASGSTIGTVGSNVVTQRFANVTAPNIIVGSRVQLYDTTNNVELFNGVLAGALNYQHTFVGNITVRLRATYQSGLTAKLPVEATGLLTATGLSFLNSQTDDGVYIGNLINGSTVTEYTPDYPNVQVDVAGGSTTTVQRLYNWSTYNETTADGIRYLFAAISAIDAVNYLIDQAILDVKLDNTGATPVVISGGVITRKDGTTVIAATSGSIQIDPAKAYVANSAEISIDLQTIKNYTAASV